MRSDVSTNSNGANGKQWDLLRNSSIDDSIDGFIVALRAHEIQMCCPVQFLGSLEIG